MNAAGETYRRGCGGFSTHSHLSIEDCCGEMGSQTALRILRAALTGCAPARPDYDIELIADRYIVGPPPASTFSVVTIFIVLDENLVDPPSAVVPAPDASANEAPGD
jgi:hypothetical protein